MKNSIALLGFAISAGFYLAAQASDNGAVCQKLASEIAEHSTVFVQVNELTPLAKTPAAYTPDLILRRMQYKDTALQNESNEIWSLRARMVNMECAQSKSFVY